MGEDLLPGFDPHAGFPRATFAGTPTGIAISHLGNWKTVTVITGAHLLSRSSDDHDRSDDREPIPERDPAEEGDGVGEGVEEVVTH